VRRRDDLLAYCRNAPEVQALIRAKVSAEGKHGTNQHKRKDGNTSIPRGRGSNSTNALRRLKRDRPEIAHDDPASGQPDPERFAHVLDHPEHLLAQEALALHGATGARMEWLLAGRGAMMARDRSGQTPEALSILRTMPAARVEIWLGRCLLRNTVRIEPPSEVRCAEAFGQRPDASGLLSRTSGQPLPHFDQPLSGFEARGNQARARLRSSASVIGDSVPPVRVSAARSSDAMRSSNCATRFSSAITSSSTGSIAATMAFSRLYFMRVPLLISDA
jgi:hypothetical protein